MISPARFASLNLCILTCRLAKRGFQLRMLLKRLAKQDDQKENQSLSHQYASYLMVTGTGTNSADLRFS